jgi:hypothetical protein
MLDCEGTTATKLSRYFVAAVPFVRASLAASGPASKKEWTEVGLIAGALAIWLPLVRMLRRQQLIARFLGLHRPFTDEGSQPTAL